MAAFDYSRSLATANRLLERFGQAGTLRRPTSSGTAYNPTAGSPTDQAATFVVIEYSRSEVDGTRILATDKRVLLAKGALTLDPTTSDQIVESGGAVFKIVNVQPLNPGGTVILYDLQVRR